MRKFVIPKTLGTAETTKLSCVLFSKKNKKVKLNGTKFSEQIPVPNSVSLPLVPENFNCRFPDVIGTFWFLLLPCTTLPETNIFAPENGWLEYWIPFGARPIFRCFYCPKYNTNHSTVDGWNLKQPPEMVLKPYKEWDKLPFPQQVVNRISNKPSTVVPTFPPPMSQSPRIDQWNLWTRKVTSWIPTKLSLMPTSLLWNKLYHQPRGKTTKQERVKTFIFTALDFVVMTSFENCRKKRENECVSAYRMVCDRCRCSDMHDVERLVYVAWILSIRSGWLKLSEVVRSARKEQDHNTGNTTVKRHTHTQRHGKHINERPAWKSAPVYWG